MKALERPANQFFASQASKKPKQVDRYEQWLRSEDQSLVEYIKGCAEDAAQRKAEGKPFKKPSLKSGFERRLFEETMRSAEAFMEMHRDMPKTFEVNGITFDSGASEAEVKELLDRYYIPSEQC